MSAKSRSQGLGCSCMCPHPVSILLRALQHLLLLSKGAHFWLLCHLQPHKAASTITWAARAQREPCLTTGAQCITVPSPHPRQWVTGLNGGARMRVTSIWLSMSSSSSPTTALHNGTNCHHLHFSCRSAVIHSVHLCTLSSGSQGRSRHVQFHGKCLQVRIACARPCQVQACSLLLPRLWIRQSPDT